MTIVLEVLGLLLLTAVASPLSGLLAVPLPLLQIALGVVAALAGFQVRFDPDTFMLLFIPPLLFVDAYRMPKRELRELRGIIFALAFGLVVFTTIGCGAAVHAMLPSVPLAACFALAAILSPTDAVAVGGMIGARPGRPPPPRRFLHILEGEALLNDASGLVCFRFAVAATMTGSFSPVGAAAAFGWIAVGGLAIGAAIGAGFVAVDRWLILRRTAEPATQIVLVILLPFASYLVADSVGTSGILAAVASGLTVSGLRLGGRTDHATRLQTGAIWSMIGFAFNGAIFLLLGLQLPGLVREGTGMAHAAGRAAWWLPLLVVAITLALAAIRAVWVVLVVGVRWSLARLAGRAVEVPRPRIVVAVAVAGVRGAVTLAGILSLPDRHGAVAGFPDRGLLIVLAAGVIVASLVLASVALPPLLAGADADPIAPMARETDRTRQAMARAALEEVERARQAEQAPAGETTEQAALRDEAVGIVASELNRRLRQFTPEDEAHDRALDESRLAASLRLRGMRASRAELDRLARAREVSDEVERLIQRELDMEEMVLLGEARALPRAAGPGEAAG